MGTAYRNQLKFAEALPFLERALDMFKQLLVCRPRDAERITNRINVVQNRLDMVVNKLANQVSDSVRRIVHGEGEVGTFIRWQDYF